MAALTIQTKQANTITNDDLWDIIQVSTDVAQYDGRTIGYNRATNETTQSRNDNDFQDVLSHLFFDLPDFTLQNEIEHQEEQREEIAYYSSENSDSVGQQMDTVIPTGDTLYFLADREAGKVISAYPSVIQRFLYKMHVPKAQIDVFFKDGFLGQYPEIQSTLVLGLGQELQYVAGEGLFRDEYCIMVVGYIDAMLVPVLFASYATHLTNLSGD
ncbi:hypothetical protein BGX38DRAFT_1147702 [Terfezia claveryi]|nr:hypothetical protein BGX38DRAFT_1147702 [Terfezia claveryi]